MTNLHLKSWRHPLLVMGVLLIALLALAACSSVSLPTLTVPSTAAPETATPAADSDSAASDSTASAATTTVVAEPAVPDVATGTHKGIPVGFTAEGFPFRGQPDAPVTIREYSDFECPFCIQHFVQTEPALLDAYLSTGQVRMIFRDFPIESLHPNAPAAHVASLCVAEQGAEQYWAMHDKIFQTQSEWGNSIDPGPVFERLAGEIGIDLDAYKACLVAGEKPALIAASLNEGQVAGVTGTPSFEISWAGGEDRYVIEGARPYEVFAENIEALLAGEMPPIAAELAQAEAEAQAAQQTPFWATPDGWQPDPNRPGANLAGDYYRGDLDAKVVIIEYSDFQCPFCQRHVKSTQPILDEKYVDTGNVMWIYRHFPLNIHPQAPAAGVAAECAGDQGLFWEMHDKLFEDPQAWSVSEPNPIFTDYARELGLDVDAFTSCLSDDSTMVRVQNDLQEGTSIGASGTPLFLVFTGTGDYVRPIEGALAVGDFETFLDELLTAIESRQ